MSKTRHILATITGLGMLVGIMGCSTLGGRPMDELLSKAAFHVIVNDEAAIPSSGTFDLATKEADLDGIWIPLTQEELVWAVRRDDTQLLQDANRVLGQWRQDGTLDAILDRWVNIRGAAYVSPSGTDIMVRHSPVRFSVRLTNVSGKSQRISVDKMNGALKSVRFEITTAKGRRLVVTRKQAFAASTLWVTHIMQPGETAAVSILMNEDEWENYSAVKPGDEHRMKVCVVVENGSKKYKSTVYNVVVDVPPPPAAFAEFESGAKKKEAPPIFVVE
ncbi:MAG: transporter substrate-binding domain-containing protein [Kiritimatiellae bacterium]|nr:transporter substrate-binding domain-containing protein [Kiritimatiellia bacterium]